MNKKNIRLLKKQFKLEDQEKSLFEDNDTENYDENYLTDDFDENSFLNSPFSVEGAEKFLQEEEEEEEEEEPRKKVFKEKTSKEKYYVEPKKFDQEIIKYYDSGVMSDELAEMVSKIANKLSYASNFVNYTYREEMVGDGIVRMFKALMSKKYDREKGTNPFSYFTRIAFNAFRNRIKKEKYIHEAHEKYQQEFMVVSEGYNNLLKNNQTKITKEIERKYYE